MRTLFEHVYVPAFLWHANASGVKFASMKELGHALVAAAQPDGTKVAGAQTVDTVIAGLLKQAVLAAAVPAALGAGIGAITGSLAEPRRNEDQADTVKRHSRVGLMTGGAIGTGAMAGAVTGGSLAYLLDKLLKRRGQDVGVGALGGAVAGGLAGGALGYRFATKRKKNTKTKTAGLPSYVQFLYRDQT